MSNLFAVDFAELRKQKDWLLQKAMHGTEDDWDMAAGLVILIDALQDTYVERGLATEEEVFGQIDNDN